MGTVTRHTQEHARNTAVIMGIEHSEGTEHFEHAAQEGSHCVYRSRTRCPYGFVFNSLVIATDYSSEILSYFELFTRYLVEHFHSNQPSDTPSGSRNTNENHSRLEHDWLKTDIPERESTDT